MAVTNERLNQLANDPMMCNITPEVQECLRELIALRAAMAEVWAVASGEKQVAMDDTQGMEWISDYVSSVYGEQKV